jgi:hypothetical protein
MIPSQARRRFRAVARTLRPRAGGVANARDAMLLQRQQGDQRRDAALLQARALGPHTWTRLHEHQTYPVLPAAHGVHFWTTDASMLDQLAAFVAGGLADGQHCLVIATAAHRAGLHQRLTLCGLTASQLVEFDADDLLDRLVGPNGLDTELFEETVGEVARAAADDPGGVRAFGEMVGILAERGELETALQLERTWCALASTITLPLLCAYRLSGTGEDEDLRRQAGAQHSHLADQAI